MSSGRWMKAFWLIGLKRPERSRSAAMTSGSEAQPNVPAEAAFGGTAVCASNLPVMAEFGWRHEETCLFHPVGDVARLAGNLARLLDDRALASRLVSAAAVSARAHYGMQAFTERLLALVDETAA